MRMAAPPGRKSNSQTGLVNLWGPQQRARCFGSVHTLNTSYRGVKHTGKDQLLPFTCDEASCGHGFSPISARRANSHPGGPNSPSRTVGSEGKELVLTRVF